MPDARNQQGIVSHDDTPASGPDWVRLLRRRWALVTFSALASAAIVSLIMLIFVPREYESSATVVVMPLQFSSNLRPPPIGVQGYQRILESDAVIEATAKALADNNVLQPAEIRNLPARLQSRIFVSRRAEETVLAPVIELIATGSTGAEAAAIANAWANAFLTAGRDLVGASVSASIELAENQYAGERSRGDALKQQGRETALTFQERLDEAAYQADLELSASEEEWNRRLVELRQATEDLVADFQVQTRELMWAAATGEARYGDSPSSSRGASGAVESDVETALGPLVALRIQLAQTPQLISVSRGISDEALWQSLASDDENLARLNSLTDLNLRAQEANPAFNELVLRTAAMESQIEALPVDPTARRRMRDTADLLEQLQRDRNAGLVKLLASQVAEYDATNASKIVAIAAERRRKDRQLDAIRRERDLLLTQIDRDLEHSFGRLEELATIADQAALAKQDRDHLDIQMGSRAAPSLTSRPRGIALAATVALVLGALFGLIAAFFREVGTG